MIKEIFGKKLGMTQIFDEESNAVSVTLVEIEPVCILEKISYPALRRTGSSKEKVKIGCFKIPPERINKVKKSCAGYFNKIGSSVYKIIKEVDYDTTQEVIPKKEVGVESFEKGSFVNVRAKTKGKGFQGGMKRHKWSGQPKGHGSTSHRRIGSCGASAYPSKIIKGLRMPGHMGNVFRVLKNLKVLQVNKEKNLLFLKGSIPGNTGAVVSIKKTGK
ncbi:MAG: 50S ribosomal protein L3 [Candidatus Omnitrophica bacterium]|nr:50S ribosomal protein L3 [Candidatus Omnitrophota bacterium]